MSVPILPGAVLGVFGGGQLGRMFALAARRMGYDVAVFAPEAEPPAAAVASRVVRSSYEDLDAVRAFASSVSAVTVELEGVPAATLDAAAQHVPARPAGSVLHVVQHRRREKEALRAAGVPCVTFAAVESEPDLRRAIEVVGAPAILKTSCSGYDGRGQTRVARAEDAVEAWMRLGRAPSVLEAVASFEREISVVGARGSDGSVALYPPVENVHVRHVLDVSTAPARLPADVERRAGEITRTLLEAWGVVGVICVELFLLPDGELLVNEVAPRPHNSGHLTIEAHASSQFEQQVRVTCGLPLGSPEAIAPAAMANLLGDLWEEGEPDWAAALAIRGVRLHLYGKRRPRPGRKMGHLTALASSVDEARERVLHARSLLTARRSRSAGPGGAAQAGPGGAAQGGR